MRKVFGTLGLLCAILGAQANDRPQLPEHVSLVQLIANPEKYDGKVVNVVGYLYFGGVDGDALYLHREDYDNAIGANALAVDRTKQMLQDREKLYDNYVLIVGVFRLEKVPSLFFSSGRITSIERCQFWSEPGHPRSQPYREMRTKPD